MTIEFFDQQTLQEPYRSIGVVVGPRGLRGEVRVKPWDMEAPWIEVVEKVVLSAPGRIPKEVTIQWAQLHGDVVWMKFAEIATRDEAEQLKGMELKVLDSALPQREENEFYVEDLVGLSVKSLDSDKLVGPIQAVSSSAAGDFLEVLVETSGETVLVPFQEVFVREVNPDKGIVEVTGLDSLFE